MLPRAWLDWVGWFVERAELYLLSDSALRGYAKFGIVLAVTVALEIAARKNWRVRYGSRNFRVDCLYYVFYYSGLYHVLVFAWMYRALAGLVTEHAPWLQMHLLAGMSPPMQIVTLIVASDFFGYWIHRMTHANRCLWAFHSIHHSQTTLTVMTNFRFHLVDETLRRILVLIPLLVILGPSIVIWLWVDFAMAWILLVQHSEWNWSYGHAGRLLVSPVFHRMHHSTDERLQNRNFSVLFSFWDDLFGTAERKAQCPSEYGLEGNPIPETIFGQFVYPIAKIVRDFRHPVPGAAAVVRPTRNAAE